MATDEHKAGEAVGGFTDLTPDVLLDAVERALDLRLTGFAHPLNSYINRVYELQAQDRTRLIAKFYRPGRWSRQALVEEHRFVAQCAEDDIPVVAPLALRDGSTLGDCGGISFAVYPKRAGRAFEPVTDEDWRRLGWVVARLHMVGQREDAPTRVRLLPTASMTADLKQIAAGEFVTLKHRREFVEVTQELLRLVTPLFADVECLRIHGDCHHGNLLDRPGEGLLVIDFDDMAVGPAMQDLWMLLPDRVENSRRELELIVEGYEDFQEFDWQSLRLIEPLRTMRLLYFTAWCSRQTGDLRFEANFPGWGSDAFWQKEIQDLQRQRDAIRRAVSAK